MNSSKYKYNLRIPQDISLILCKNKNVVTVAGPLKKKSMKLKLKILINQKKKFITVSSVPLFKASNAEKKRIDMLRSTTLAQIKYLFIESSVIFHKKLKIVGVGFKTEFAPTFLEDKILNLKIGRSHPTYMKIPENSHFKNTKKTKFCVYGDFYNEVSEFSAALRAQKAPEPYKGKGILYENEKINLKEGKKI